MQFVTTVTIFFYDLDSHLGGQFPSILVLAGMLDRIALAMNNTAFDFQVDQSYEICLPLMALSTIPIDDPRISILILHLEDMVHFYIEFGCF
jgi:hypothetical protein